MNPCHVFLLSCILLNLFVTVFMIDPVLLWSLVKLLKEVRKAAETIDDIRQVSVTQDIYKDLQKLRKSVQNDIPDLKSTIMEQRFEQDIDFPSKIVFEAANEYLKRPHANNRHVLEHACQKFTPSFILRELYYMVDDEGRNWYLEMLKIEHYSSKQAAVMEERVTSKVEEILLNHAFCTSLLEYQDEYNMNITMEIGNDVKTMVKEQRYKASQLYYPEQLELFAENFVDSFDRSVCFTKRDCNELLSHQLTAVLNEEFDYGQVMTLRVSQKEPHFTGKMPIKNAIQIKTNGFHVLIYLTNMVTGTPLIDPGVQDVLDRHHSFFLLQNTLCNWNPFSHTGTLVNVFGALEGLCGNSTLCTVTKTDHDSEMVRGSNVDSKCLSFACFPFVRGVTLIQGIYDGTEDDRVYKKIVNTNEKSLWEILLETGIKVWTERWEQSKRSKRHMSVEDLELQGNGTGAVDDDYWKLKNISSDELYKELKARVLSDKQLARYSEQLVYLRGAENNSASTLAGFKQLFFVYCCCFLFFIGLFCWQK